MDSDATVELHDLGTRQGELDYLDHAAKVQRIIGNNRTDNPVAIDGDVVIYQMVLTNREKLLHLWRMAIKHRSLFWHDGMKDEESFMSALFNPCWVFFEVYKNGYLSGFVYFSEVCSFDHVQLHAVFFDRALTDKLIVGKLLIHWMFDRYPIERIEAAIAENFHATHRFVQNLGMKYEGTRRRGTILRGSWVNQKVYSVIREDL